MLQEHEPGNWSDNETNPERRDTGPFTHSPPSSKYLKQPVRNTCNSSPSHGALPDLLLSMLRCDKVRMGDGE